MKEETVTLEPLKRSTWTLVQADALGGEVRAVQRVPLGMPWHPPPDFLLWLAHAEGRPRHHALSDAQADAWMRAGVVLTHATTDHRGHGPHAWVYLGTRATLRTQLKGADVFPLKGAEGGLVRFGFTEGGYVPVGVGVVTGEGAAVEPDVDGRPTCLRVHAALGARWATATADCSRATVEDTRVTVDRGVYALHANVLGDVPRDRSKPPTLAEKFFPEFHGDDATMMRAVTLPWTEADGDPRDAMNAYLAGIRLADGEEWCF